MSYCGRHRIYLQPTCRTVFRNAPLHECTKNKWSLNRRDGSFIGKSNISFFFCVSFCVYRRPHYGTRCPLRNRCGRAFPTRSFSRYTKCAMKETLLKKELKSKKYTIFFQNFDQNLDYSYWWLLRWSLLSPYSFHSCPMKLIQYFTSGLFVE